MDSKKRTLLKAACWQVLGLITMVIVGIGFTGSYAIGGAMALFNAALGLVVYVIYERVWAGVSWGRAPVQRGVRDV